MLNINFTAKEALAIIAGDVDMFVHAELAALRGEIEALPPYKRLSGDLNDRFEEAFMAG